MKEEVSLLKEINSKSQQIEDANSLEKYYLQQLDQLKAENEILKEKITISSNSDKITLKIIKTLTDIKEFVENEMTQNGDTYIILQKISAAENDHIVDVNNMVGECIPDEGKSSDHIPDVGNMVETR